MMSNHNAIVNSPMDLGTTMAVFIVVAVVLMALFCLLLKCFSYQLSKRLKKAAHLYTDGHDLESPHADGWEGEYDQFCRKREEKDISPLKQTLMEEDVLIEMHELRKDFNMTNNIYGLTNLREKLNEDKSRMMPTKRLLVPMFDFNLDRFNQLEDEESDLPSDIFGYTLIKRLIRYDRQGIHLIEVTPLTLRKQGEQIVLGKSVEESLIDSDQPSFEDILESYGYELHNYGCSKLVCEVQVAELKPNTTYSFKALSTKEHQEYIGLSEQKQLLQSITDTQQSEP